MREANGIARIGPADKKNTEEIPPCFLFSDKSLSVLPDDLT